LVLKAGDWSVGRIARIISGFDQRHSVSALTDARRKHLVLARDQTLEIGDRADERIDD
jgi:hypothetical protein